MVQFLSNSLYWLNYNANISIELYFLRIISVRSDKYGNY